MDIIDDFMWFMLKVLVVDFALTVFFAIMIPGFVAFPPILVVSMLIAIPYWIVSRIIERKSECKSKES